MSRATLLLFTGIYSRPSDRQVTSLTQHIAPQKPGCEGHSIPQNSTGHSSLQSTPELGSQTSAEPAGTQLAATEQPTLLLLLPFLFWSA